MDRFAERRETRAGPPGAAAYRLPFLCLKFLGFAGRG